jgi:hypothetical protein
MDFDEALRVHSELRLRLVAYLRKPDGSMDEDEVGNSNLCELGLWIRGDGRRFERRLEYLELRADHARFHDCAGSVVRRANWNRSEGEKIELGPYSPYGTAWVHLANAIRGMKLVAP